jgi:hypothetical protein
MLIVMYLTHCLRFIRVEHIAIGVAAVLFTSVFAPYRSVLLLVVVHEHETLFPAEWDGYRLVVFKNEMLGRTSETRREGEENIT